MTLEQKARKLAARIGQEPRSLVPQLRHLKYAADPLAARKPGPRKRHEFSTEAWIRLWAVKPAAERIRKS